MDNAKTSALRAPRLIHPKERIEDAMTRVDRMMFQKPGDKPVASIPAREDYDTDLVLSDAIHELFQLREKLASHHSPMHMCFTCWLLDHPGEARRVLDELIQPAPSEGRS